MDKSTLDDLHTSLSQGTTPDMQIIPRLDVADYINDLDEFALTEAQKVELLETLWSIMGSVARMGMSVDVCGLIFEEFNEAAALESRDGNLVAATQMETPSQEEGEKGNV